MERIAFSDEDRKRLFFGNSKENNAIISKLANYFDINFASMKEYAKGITTTPLSVAKELCRINKLDFNTLKLKRLPSNWGQVKAGYATYIHNFGEHVRPKSIGNPVLSPELAEFIGIYLGDGTLTKYFVRIVGDIRYDRPYFDYISKLVKNLFNLDSKLSLQVENTALLTILSVSLCKLLTEKYKLKFGDKKRNLTVIPEEIFNDEKLVLHCLRGIVDTDGCLGKSGCNFKLTVCSHNPALLKQLNQINDKYGFFNRIYGQKLETCSMEKAKKYMSIVGSSNLRHIVRFNEKLNNDKLLYRYEVLDYYERYKSIKLPFYEPVV